MVTFFETAGRDRILTKWDINIILFNELRFRWEVTIMI